MAKGALKFKNMMVAKQPQEIGRLRVIGGPEAGAMFVITAPRVSLGRGEENEIAIMDLKMSRKHAEIIKGPQGILIQDLASANGLVINGAPMRQWFLKNGDKIGIGNTVLEFISADMGRQMMLVPPSVTSSQVGTGTSGLTKFIKMPTADKSAATSKNLKSDPGLFEKNKKFMTVMGVLLLLAYAMPQAEQQARKRKPRYEPPNELSSAASHLKNFLPSNADSEVKKRAETYFKEGYREYVEKNYLRAKGGFEITLQIYPDHELARRYLKNVEEDMKKEALDHRKSAKVDEAANRKHSALNHFDAIRRLYFRDQSNPLYKEADTAYKALEEKMKEQP